MRPDAAQRLAESFETALALAQGTSRASAFHDEPEREPLVFSNRYACTVCGYSLTGLEPRLFSFNNPNGACGTCGGLGVQEYLRPRARGRQPGPVARRRRHPRLGPPQRLLLPADPVARAALPLRHRGAVERAARKPCGTRAAVGSGDEKIAVPLLRRARRRHRCTHAWKASCRTSSGAYRETESRDRARGTRAVPRHAPVRRLPRQPA
mgnify:CR=1 FL=1